MGEDIVGNPCGCEEKGRVREGKKVKGRLGRFVNGIIELRLIETRKRLV